jgi:hypothetical protein
MNSSFSGLYIMVISLTGSMTRFQC